MLNLVSVFGPAWCHYGGITLVRANMCRLMNDLLAMKTLSRFCMYTGLIPHGCVHTLGLTPN
jgi:hypothetical protein